MVQVIRSTDLIQTCSMIIIIIMIILLIIHKVRHIFYPFAIYLLSIVMENIELHFMRRNDSSNFIDTWLAVDNKFIGHKIFHFRMESESGQFLHLCARCLYPNARMRKVIGPLIEFKLTAIKSKWINLRFRNSGTGRLFVYCLFKSWF